jgi:hypothetical protein
MGDLTYDSAAEAEADKAQQRSLLEALGAWDKALRRDECGAWTIRGTRGTVHTNGDGKTWIMFVGCRSDRHWGWVKKALSFCSVILDCDGEGTLRLQQLPTAEQAAVIRAELGIRKKQTVSEATLERLKAFSFEKCPRDGATNGPIFPLPASQPSIHPYRNPEPAFPAQTPSS